MFAVKRRVKSLTERRGGGRRCGGNCRGSRGYCRSCGGGNRSCCGGNRSEAERAEAAAAEVRHSHSSVWKKSR